MKATKTKILKEANKVYDFISRETLSSTEKKWAIAETVKGFKAAGH